MQCLPQTDCLFQNIFRCGNKKQKEWLKNQKGGKMFITMSSANQHKHSFESSCVQHLDNLYLAAYKLTQNKTDAEELVQDTYVRAFRFKKNFEPGSNLKAWLFRILTNTFINNYRHKNHERKFVERSAVEPVYDKILNEQAKAYSSNPESYLFSSFFKSQLEKALDELPEDFKIVVILSDLQDFSYKEISKMLDCPIGTVMSRLHRGRKLLQRHLVDFAIDAGIVSDNKDTEATDLNQYRIQKEILK
jgi:RNA polymerase sigma-70 factor (ECF subfamily)